jgi:hypothetical protein
VRIDGQHGSVFNERRTQLLKQQALDYYKAIAGRSNQYNFKFSA